MEFPSNIFIRLRMSSRYFIVTTLIKILRIANSIIMERQRFWHIKALTLSYKPPKKISPSSAPFVMSATIDARVFHFFMYGKARWGHHASRQVWGSPVSEIPLHFDTNVELVNPASLPSFSYGSSIIIWVRRGCYLYNRYQGYV